MTRWGLIKYGRRLTAIRSWRLLLPVCPLHGRHYDIARDEVYVGWGWFSVSVSLDILSQGFGIRFHTSTIRPELSAKISDQAFHYKYEGMKSCFKPELVKDT